MKRICFCFLLFIVLLLPLTADQGNNSDSIYSYLQSEGFAPHIILNRTQSKDFPYNIYLDFPSISPLDSSALIISISQDDAPFFIEGIVQFAKEMKNFARETEVIIVFTAGDSAYLPAYVSLPSPTGTSTFLENIDTSQKIAAVLLQKAQRPQKAEIAVTAGITKRTTAHWLLDSLFYAAKKTNTDTEIYGGNLTAYRLGLIFPNLPLMQYYSAQIPAIQLQCATSDVCRIFPPLLDRLEKNRMRIWDNHYGLLQLKNRVFFIPELVFVILLILMAVIILLFFCLFSFFKEKTRILHLDDLKKIWFLIPLLLIFTALCLCIGQIIVKKLIPLRIAQPLTAAALKVSLAVLFAALASLLHKFIHFPTNDYVYAWLSNIISFINLFIFTSLELSLIMFFAIQFIIYFLASYFRKTRFLLLSAVVITLTFVPFILSLSRIPHETIYLRFANASLYENILIAFLLVPMEFMWIRILVRLRLFGNKARFSFPFIIATVILISIIGIICSSMIKTNQAERQRITVADSTGRVECTSKRESFLDRSRIELNLESKLQPVKTEVSVTSDAGMIIYDSNYPFSNNEKTEFLLDEFPPNPLNIVYTCEKDAACEVSVITYMKDNDGNLFKETNLLKIEP